MVRTRSTRAVLMMKTISSMEGIPIITMERDNHTHKNIPKVPRGKRKSDPRMREVMRPTRAKGKGAKAKTIDCLIV